MKNRVFVALLLAVVLALPAVAQQSGSTTQDQPAASQPATSQSTGTATQDQPAASQPATSQSTGTATQDQPAASQPAQSAPAAPADQNATQTAGPGASGKPALQPDTHEGFWGHLNPFARKKYVQRQTAPIRDRVNELDELTAANSKMIKDVDSRAQEGVRLASTKANEADQHAIDAGNKAQMAQQTATQANTRLTTVEQVVGNIDQYKAANQTEIRFRPGQTVLSKNAKAALDDMATPLKNQRGYIIEVQGFSSGPARLPFRLRRRWLTPLCATWCSTTKFRSTGSTWSAWATLRSRAPMNRRSRSRSAPAVDAWKSAS